MPGAFPCRPSRLPGYGSLPGITIPPLAIAKGVSMFHSSKFHLDQVDESYTQHFRAALGIAARLAVASAACAVHALIPSLCTRTASRRVAALHSQLAARGGGFEVESS